MGGREKVEIVLAVVEGLDFDFDLDFDLDLERLERWERWELPVVVGSRAVEARTLFCRLS